ncbi:MAG: AAA family ATPase, partial [Candidatus Aenigmarchaeota archaeon]|nr:AAA family ATPase [Candidatus Aenigmarchaeota archaeon]
MIKQFINRTDELQLLNSAYASDRAEFIVVYGRRRIGKTELIREFIKDKQAIYYLADEREDSQNLSEFRNIVADELNNELLKSSNVGWVDVLKEVSKTKTRLIVAIDEFPFLINSNKAITSLFQKAWDLYLENSNIMLILCGSSISMMEQHVIGVKSPLYGRRTGQIKLNSIEFKYINKFLSSKFSTEELVKIYAITDGIPYYLKEANFRVKKIKDI